MDLLSINVNEHTEKKNGLTYLSWAWAWAEVLKIDPHAEWVPLYFGQETNQVPFIQLPDGSMMVGVTVHMKGKARQCLLPVMDHRNKAIKNPDAFAVNTAMMRCLAKAIAMHGLGLYIYAGEDLPQVAAEPTAEELAAQKRTAELEEVALYMIDAHKEGKDSDAIRIWYDPATFSPDAETANEERIQLWGMLKSESKLRAAIKANKPEAVSA
jgi:hypothetical protein